MITTTTQAREILIARFTREITALNDTRLEGLITREQWASRCKAMEIELAKHDIHWNDLQA